MSPLTMPSGKPLVLRGSLVVIRRKCGRPACRCAQGQLHEGPALSYSLAGKTHVLTLREEDVPEVTAALARYQAAADALEADAMGGIATLREHVRQRKRGRRFSQ